MPERDLPEWLFSPDASPEYSEDLPPADNPVIADPPLLHLLPQLRAFLELKDPDRVDRAMELLVNCESEEELFSDLQAQYGDVNSEDVEKVARLSDQSKIQADPMRVQASKPPRSSAPPGRPSSQISNDKDLEDFIVPDSEEIESEEDEFEILPTSRDRSRSPKRGSAGPQIVCKYGKACYRKNPVHFQEFAHPWLPNGGPP
jgi:hypothetical protein